MPTVRLDPLHYAAAADLFRAIADNAMSHHASAAAELRNYGAMAGDDNGGQSFADAYDGTAQSMLQSLYDISVACSAFDRGLMSTGRMHHQAEQYAAGLPADDSAFVVRPLTPELCVVGPPSAYGGPAEPGIIDVVRDLFALIWPNADVPLMRQAARTWTGIANDFSDFARAVRQTQAPISDVVSAEAGHIRAQIDDLADGIDELAVLAGEIAEVCQGYADDVDDAHNEILPMLGQLVLEIAVGAGISVALSFVTFGAAGAVGAAAIAVRAAAIAVRVGGILSRVLANALRIATRLQTIANAMTRVAYRFKKLFEVGIEIASSTGASLYMESREKDPNYWAAAAGGLVGGGFAGGITAALASRTASLAARIGVGTFAGSVSGATGVVADNLVRYGEVDARELVLGTLLGGGLGGPLNAIPKPGGGTPGGSTPGGRTPEITTPDLPSGPDFDGDLPSIDAPDGLAGPARDTGGSDIPTGPSQIPIARGTDADISITPTEPATPGVRTDPTPDGDGTPVGDSTPDPDGTTPDATTTPDTTTPDTTTPDTTTPDTTTPDTTTPDTVVPVGADGSPYTAADGAWMSTADTVRVDLGDGTAGHRLVDEPRTFGDPLHTPVEPTPPDVLARPDVQQLLGGEPPTLVLRDGVLQLNDVTTLRFEHSNPNHPMWEMLRQGRLQENSINQRFSIQQILDGRVQFDDIGRQPDSPAYVDYRETVDRSGAPNPWTTQVLHGPDQIVAGSHDNLDGVGHGGVNASYGRQWRDHVFQLQEALDDARGVLPADLLPWVHPNVQIRVWDSVAFGKLVP